MTPPTPPPPAEAREPMPDDAFKDVFTADERYDWTYYADETPDQIKAIVRNLSAQLATARSALAACREAMMNAREKLMIIEAYSPGSYESTKAREAISDIVLATAVDVPMKRTALADAARAGERGTEGKR